jgi:hypothetical protein
MGALTANNMLPTSRSDHVHQCSRNCYVDCDVDCDIQSQAITAEISHKLGFDQCRREFGHHFGQHVAVLQLPFVIEPQQHGANEAEVTPGATRQPRLPRRHWLGWRSPLPGVKPTSRSFKLTFRSRVRTITRSFFESDPAGSAVSEGVIISRIA